MKLKYSLLCLLLAILFMASSCQRQTTGPDPSQPGNPEKIQVITTILPLYDIAKNVGGDQVEVRNLLPPGSSPHTYEPTTEESVAIEKANVIFKLGLGLDDWMDKVVGATGKQKNIVVLSQGVPTLPFVTELDPYCTHEGEHGEECEHDHGSADPHVWMDPLLMKQMAQNARDAFIKLKPDKKDVFEKNFEAYARELEALDRDYQQTFSAFEKKDFVTFHSFLQYQAKRYGINQAATIAEFPGKDPDPHHIITIVKFLKEKKVSTIFVEPQFSKKAAEAIAREINGRVVVIDPLGSLQDHERDTYVKNMRKNLASFREAFEKENRK